MTAPFLARTAFPHLTNLPRSYYLGHHAAGLARMRTLLTQIDIIIECRDARVPLTSRNPMFEDLLHGWGRAGSGKTRIIVYTKRDLSNDGGHDADLVRRREESLLRTLHRPSPVLFSSPKTPHSTSRILTCLRTLTRDRQTLTPAHAMVVGLPNVGKSTLLNALRATGVRRGKAAHTGAQPGITRKIGTGVKIFEDGSGGGGDMYLLDTPGVFIPYVPSAEAMLKLALVGSVKDTVIPPFTLADYLLFHVNQQDPSVYSSFREPTNDIAELLNAMAGKIGRLGKGGEVDLEGTAMWMIQRWRNGFLGRFGLDTVDSNTVQQYGTDDVAGISLNQARKAGKQAARVRSKSGNESVEDA